MTAVFLRWVTVPVTHAVAEQNVKVPESRFRHDAEAWNRIDKNMPVSSAVGDSSLLWTPLLRRMITSSQNMSRPEICVQMPAHLNRLNQLLKK